MKNMMLEPRATLPNTKIGFLQVPCKIMPNDVTAYILWLRFMLLFELEAKIIRWSYVCVENIQYTRAAEVTVPIWATGSVLL